MKLIYKIRKLIIPVNIGNMVNIISPKTDKYPLEKETEIIIKGEIFDKTALKSINVYGFLNPIL